MPIGQTPMPAWGGGLDRLRHRARFEDAETPRGEVA
jgi:hypothetical protein